MSVIAFPYFAKIRSIDWTLDRPAQVNVSGYTGARGVVANPWHGKWRARVQLSTLVGTEVTTRWWRSFFAKLKGQINTTWLPATEGPQYTPTVNAITNIANRANTTVTSLGGNEYRITKSGGTNGVSDAQADSTTALTGDFVLRCKIGGTQGFFLGFKLSSGGAIGTAHKQISVANGILTYVDFGSQNQSGITSYVTGQYLWVVRRGYSLSVLLGNTTNLADAVFIYQFSESNVFGTLYFDWYAGTSGATCDVMLTFTPLVTLSANASQGATQISFTGSGMPNVNAIEPGWLATVQLNSGKRQLVIVTQYVANPVIIFEPPLREAANSGNAVELCTPWAEVALGNSTFGWQASAGKQYDIAFDVEEAF